MRNLLQHKNKKAVSEIVSYVFLIIIAIGLSIGVFAYLKIYVPKDQVTCDKEVSLIVSSYSCTISGSKINLAFNLTNNGLFNVSGAFLRFDETGKKVKNSLNTIPRFQTSTGELFQLAPGETYETKYDPAAKSGITKYDLEVEPIILGGKSGQEVALCNKAIIVQTLDCS